MKHSLQLRLSQRLTLTPQLQQSIKLLQLSTIELNQEVERILLENPLLERVDSNNLPEPAAKNPDAAPSSDEQRNADSYTDVVDGEISTEPVYDSGSDMSSEDHPSTDYAAADAHDNPFDALDKVSYGSNSDGDDEDFSPVAEQPPSLRAHLSAQLALLHLSDRDRQLVLLLIDSLDDGGYLPLSLEEVAEMLPPELEVEPEELSIALQHLQHLEPIGIGARTLAECLTLQLQSTPAHKSQRNVALEIVQHHLDALAARDFSRLKRMLKCDDAVLKAAHKLIVSLNPKPGRDYSVEETRFVIADVITRKTKGIWVAELNPDAMPKLKINQLYANILQRNRGGGTQQISSQLQEARWLIKNVHQRFETIQRVSQAIVDRQRNFLEHGPVAMRPLVLREIADTLELHESTISRVTTQKFMHTPRGIYELKYFFGSQVSTDSGGSASSTAIRALIKQLISAENTRTPLSDGHISEVLSQQGIVVARRTVAKYRESMQILPVNLRKTL
jgi:RNA polymerase sigma-54 factor